MESQHLGYSVRYISSIPYRSTAYYLFYFQTTPYRPYHFAYSFSRTEAAQFENLGELVKNTIFVA